jgi:hypothetical protein
MNSPQEEIDELKAEINRYSDELKSATTEERKDRWLDAITVRSKILNTLLIQQQQQQQGGKFYSLLVCGVGLSSCYNLVY